MRRRAVDWVGRGNVIIGHKGKQNSNADWL
jgi:hypothetical protein